MPLILASNRDEFHQRPTSAAHWQGGADGAQRWLGGRDERDGGSWLGVSAAGRFAVITNYRNPAADKPDAKSRGALVRRWLEGEALTSFGAHLEQDSRIYNGFNLLFGEIGDVSQLFYFQNHSDTPSSDFPSQPCRLQPLEAGVYGLSNASLDSAWPKVEKGRAAFERMLAEDVTPDTLPAELLAVMSDATPAADNALPQTGVPLEWERMLSSLFIVSPAYGTRATTAVCVEQHTAAVNVRFVERQVAPSGESAGEHSEQFEILPMFRASSVGGVNEMSSADE